MKKDNANQNPAGINELLDEIIERHIKSARRNDAALSRAMGVAPPVISKMRNGKVAMSDGVKIRIHELFGLSISYIQQKLGVNSVNQETSNG